jgi:hypothetical protein
MRCSGKPRSWYSSTTKMGKRAAMHRRTLGQAQPEKRHIVEIHEPFLAKQILVRLDELGDCRIVVLPRRGTSVQVCLPVLVEISPARSHLREIAGPFKLRRP